MTTLTVSPTLDGKQQSPLDTPPAHFADTPFSAETVTRLRSVRDHDFVTLAALCDDDFGCHASVISSDVPAELRSGAAS